MAETLTHNNLPVLLVGADLVAGPHLAVGGAAGDEDEDPGHRLGRSLVLLVLVPVAVTVAGGSRPLGVLSLASQEREVVVVELVLDGLLHNVLHHRGPSRHLICVLAWKVFCYSIPEIFHEILLVLSFLLICQTLRRFPCNVRDIKFEDLKSITERRVEGTKTKVLSHSVQERLSHFILCLLAVSCPDLALGISPVIQTSLGDSEHALSMSHGGTGRTNRE